MRRAASQALPSLVVNEDVPMLADRMREGHLDLELAFERLDAPEAVAAQASPKRYAR